MPPVARSLALGTLFEVFLITAVVSLLAIRAGLALTGFPRIGGGGLHIAHMLWGGLFMLLSLLLLLGFIGRVGLYLAALLGGIGFGTFIDELGKFITSDNNYFFQPAVAIIYAIFVLLFLLSRALESPSRLSGSELLANAFDAARDASFYHRRPGDVEKVLAYLRSLPDSTQALAALREALTVAEERPPLMPVRLTELQDRITRRYYALVASHRLNRVAVIMFVIYAVFAALSTLAVVGALVAAHAGVPYVDFSRPGVDELGIIVSNAVTAAFLVIGVWRLRTSRLGALRWFDRAIVVDLLLAQVFNFYESQFGALIGTAIDVLILLLVRGMMRAEGRLREKHLITAEGTAEGEGGELGSVRV
jgi:hypothetical protein